MPELPTVAEVVLPSGLGSSESEVGRRFHLKTAGEMTKGWSMVRVRELIDGGHLEFCFQPIVEFSRAKIIGYEALLRVDSGSGGPAELLRFAHSHQVGVALEAGAIEAVRSAMATRPPNTLITVNVSSRALSSGEVASSLGGDLDDLVLELDAKILGGQLSASTLNYLTELRDRGALISVDWDGADLQALKALTRIRPNVIKIKRSLIVDIDQDDTRAHAVLMMLSLATAIGAWVVAEGIEQPEELGTVIRLGIPLGQGWLLGRELPRFQSLEPAAIERIRGLNARGSKLGTVSRLVQPTEFVLPGDCPGAGGNLTVMVGTDMKGRAVSVWTRPSSQCETWNVGPVTLQIRNEDDISTVAKRALSRSLQTRFDPILCVGPTGLVVGVVSIESLFRHLAEENDGRGARLLSFRANS